MAEWLRPSKFREYYVDRRFDDVNEAERQLYFAVIGGKVRARSKGRVLMKGLARAIKGFAICIGGRPFGQ